MKRPSLLLNLAYNWTGQGANLLVMFFLSPLVVHSFGNTVYGIWSLLTVLTGYLGLLDMGIRSSTGRYVNYYLSRNEHQAVKETIKTSLCFYLLLGLVFVAAGLIFSFFFNKAFPQIPTGYEGLLRIVFPLLAANIWLTATSSIFASVVAAHERFDRIQAVNMTVLAIRTVGTLYIVHNNYGILGLSITIILANLTGCILNYASALRLYHNLELFPLRISGDRLRELFTFGVAAFLSSVAYTLINETDVVLTGALIGIDEVTFYTIGGMLILYSWGFVEQIGFTVFPSLQRAAARNETENVHYHMLRQIRTGLFFALPVYISFLVFGEEFIRLWMGQEYESSSQVLWILSIARLIALFSIAMGPCLTALGMPRYNVFLMLAEALVNLISSILFVIIAGLGINGIALGTLTAVILVRMVLQPLITLRKIELPITRYLRTIIAPGTSALVLVLICGIWISSTVQISTWVEFVFSVIGLLIISMAVSIPLLTTTEERQLILKKFSHQAGDQ